MTLKSPEYWYGRLDNLMEFKHRCKAFQEVLSIFPEDYIDLQKELKKTINQNELNLLWIRQEIATREALQDFPGANNGK